MNFHALGRKCWMCNKQGGKNRSFRQKVGLKFMVFFFNADRSQYSKSNWESSSYSLDFVGNDYRVLLTNLVSSFGSVVIRTVVLIRVTVKSAEQIPTAAVKTWNRGRTVSNQWQVFTAAKLPELYTVRDNDAEKSSLRMMWSASMTLDFIDTFSQGLLCKNLF